MVVRQFIMISSLANARWRDSGVRCRDQSRAKGIPTWSFARARCVDGSCHAGGRAKQRREVLVSMTGSNVCTDTHTTTMMVGSNQTGPQGIVLLLGRIFGSSRISVVDELSLNSRDLARAHEGFHWLPLLPIELLVETRGSTDSICAVVQLCGSRRLSRHWKLWVFTRDRVNAGASQCSRQHAWGVELIEVVCDNRERLP